MSQLAALVFRTRFLHTRCMKATRQPFTNCPRLSNPYMASKALHPSGVDFKALDPKFGSVLTAVRDAGGRLHTGLADVERIVRATRPFWLLPPPEVSPDLANILPDYVSRSKTLSSLPQPPADAYLAVIHKSGNSGTGIDGIPYATYRCAPQHTASLLHAFSWDLVHAPHTI